MNKPKPASILIVDDDPSVLAALRDILTDAGYTVADAMDGRKAVMKFRTARPDIVITDIVMPDQEGVETIRQLKIESPGLKIIAMSGAIGGRYLRVAELMGADATLQKPIKIDQLLESVKKVLR
ncbi:MAG: response regulator [Bryobacterales bacterium]|nr:response regulator [Bryobacterales bacterium]